MFRKLGQKMFRKLAISALALGCVFVFVTINDYGDAKELEQNYKLVDATITTVSIDCFIKKREEKVIEKKSGDLAYVSCQLAPLVAAQHGFDTEDIQERATITYRYTSPVDHRSYTGTFKSVRDVTSYKTHNVISVYAHKSNPKISRRVQGNMFVDHDDG